MVFEQVFKATWMEKRPSSTFFIAVLYTLIAIASARLVFAANSGIMSVAFLAVLLVPSLSKLMGDEERIEVKESGKFSLSRLVRDHVDIVEIYFFLFAGVFCTYFVVGLVVGEQYLFRAFTEQLAVLSNLRGGAIDISSTFWYILTNNLLVLMVIFVLSLLYGAGAILFVVWNASVWGVVFGYSFKLALLSSSGVGVLVAFYTSVIVFLPHVIIEALGYLAVAIAGGVLSKASLREKWNSAGFHHVVTDSLLFLVGAFVLVVVGAFVEVVIFPYLVGGI